MKSLFLHAILAFALAAVAIPTAQAQAPADGGPAPSGPTDTPLDGGASLLLAFEESHDQLHRNAQGWGHDFEQAEQDGLLRVVAAREDQLHQQAFCEVLKDYFLFCMAGNPFSFC